MFKRRAAFIAWLLAAPVFLPAADRADDVSAAQAAASAPDLPADAELLEYLGSVDAEGQDWMDYLAQTDIAQVAKAKKPPDKTEEEE